CGEPEKGRCLERIAVVEDRPPERPAECSYFVRLTIAPLGRHDPVGDGRLRGIDFDDLDGLYVRQVGRTVLRAPPTDILHAVREAIIEEMLFHAALRPCRREPVPRPIVFVVRSDAICSRVRRKRRCGAGGALSAAISYRGYFSMVFFRVR